MPLRGLRGAEPLLLMLGESFGGLSLPSSKHMLGSMNSLLDSVN